VTGNVFCVRATRWGALSGHQNIVNILQVGVTEGSRPFIVMPYHAAGSLAQRVQREGRIAWPEDDKKLVAQTEMFDGQSWTQAADLPTPREHLAAVSDGVYVYTVGGRNLSADENSAAFQRFDPVSGNWDRFADVPTPRGSYGAAFIDGRIVAVGGEEPTRVLATVEMYDISNGKWSTQAPLGTPRHGEVVAAVNQTVYCIGGADRPSHEGPIATVEALDFT
jgi:serine/threonine-protein kinase PknK